MFVRYVAIVALIMGLWVPESHSEETSVRVVFLYPEGSQHQPYFLAVIDTAKTHSPHSLSSIAIPKGVASPALKASYYDVVITFNKSMLPVAQKIIKKQGVVVSLSSKQEDQNVGIAMILRPKPSVIFDFIAKAAPGIRRIHAVANNEEQHYFEQAQLAAEKAGITLLQHKYSGKNVNRDKAYLDALATVQSDHDAIWVSHQLNRQVAFELLRSSWEKRTLLISNYLGQVKSGMALGFYFDSESLGKGLAELIDAALVNPEGIQNKILYQQELKTAIHTKSVKRAVYTVPQSFWSEFDVKLP